MELAGNAILFIHYCLIGILCLFGIHRLSMVFRWQKYKHTQATPTQTFDELPRVTVQIPIYNERFVAERVIDCVAELDYPKEKLQIQIVDDSTDETVDVIAKRVEYFKEHGVNIQHVRRGDRQGYKAGGLKSAMQYATGEYIAIFDADFLPNSDFILRTIHHFTDEKVGMVQTRWEHLNRASNRLTETQAMMLDSHFALEQHVRFGSRCLFNFNGTAGIWRTKTIYDSGNWSADTLTEDLDLSYRAQLGGWKLVYDNAVVCPAELPSNIEAFKSQQHRWAKGGIQVLKKMLKTVWLSPLSIKSKIESTFHLGNNLAYFVMLVDTVFFLIPSLFVRESINNDVLLWLDLPLLAFSSGGHLVYLYYGQIALRRPKFNSFVRLPWLLVLGVQLSCNNAKAALEALLGNESEFVRTPKSGELTLSGQVLKLSQKMAYRAQVDSTKLGEVVIALVYGVVFSWALLNEYWFTLPFALLLMVGFSGVAFRQFDHVLLTHPSAHTNEA